MKPEDTGSPPEHGYGPTYWRSLAERLQSQPPAGMARRDLLRLLGASLALAGVNACTRRPEQKVLPYTRTPLGVQPSTPLHFATAESLDGYAIGLLVTSWEGRPTKVEGNPDHPASRGATGVFEQALPLQLYDPGRAQLIKQRGTPRAWPAFLAAMNERIRALAATQGEGLHLLLEPTASPFLADLRRQIQERFPRAKLHGYSSLAGESGREGARMAFGQPLDAHYRFEEADVVLSLDADFLHCVPRTLPYTRAFSNRRDPEQGELNRLYVVEAMLSLTGSKADHRLRMRSSDVLGFAAALGERLAAGDPALEGAATRAFAPGPERSRWLRAVAEDLLRSRGRSIVIAGDRQPPALHALAHLMNQQLGNSGRTVRWTEPLLPDVRGVSALEELAADIDAGRVDTLLITAWNPAYTAPADLDLGARLAKVPHSIYRTLHEDETSARCEWLLPATHVLESWGDARSAGGITSIIQPLIAPLFDSYTEADVLSSLLGGTVERGNHGQLKEFWSQRAGPEGFEAQWERWVALGVTPGGELSPVEPGAGSLAATLAALPAARAQRPSALEANFIPSYTVHDGRFAGNPWLQELPDPITRLTWGNAALLSPATAAQLGLQNGDVALLELHGRSVEAPVWILPGHADGSISLPLGYGRAGAGALAPALGFNAGALRRARAPWFDGGLKLTRTGKKADLAEAQGHSTMLGHPIALTMTSAQLEHAGELTSALRGPLPTLLEPVNYEGYRWAMAVDLSRCTGCSACVVACQSENNVPVVGREEVLRGREMQWLRIDRYFKGSIEDPEVIHQPVACVHCEMAPCEYVCPVNATVHSDEGLNDMVYNRCIGTRYCSNNCPYKVRRFNYLDYVPDDMHPLRKMPFNPDVTVRARGVMEKCTYCVQRIERARIQSRIEGQPIRDGAVVTACAAACPNQAIVFGTLSDPGSRVSRLHALPRRYDLLHELNTRPRTAYLAQVKNPNPELAG